MEETKKRETKLEAATMTVGDRGGDDASRNNAALDQQLDQGQSWTNQAGKKSSHEGAKGEGSTQEHEAEAAQGDGAELASRITWAEEKPCTRDADDVPALELLANRFTHKYFPGYGEYVGKVMCVIPDRAVVEVQYEDGDGEELYLDQLQDTLLPRGYVPTTSDRSEMQGVDKFGCTWPPPSVSKKLVVLMPRVRKQSEAARRQQELEEYQRRERLQRQEQRASRAAQQKKRKQARSQVQPAGREKKASRSAPHSTASKTSKRRAQDAAARLPPSSHEKGARSQPAKKRAKAQGPLPMSATKGRGSSTPAPTPTPTPTPSPHPPREPIVFGRKPRLQSDGQTVSIIVDGVPSKIKLADIGLKGNRDIAMANMRIQEAKIVAESLRDAGKDYQGLIDVSAPIPLPPIPSQKTSHVAKKDKGTSPQTKTGSKPGKRSHVTEEKKAKKKMKAASKRPKAGEIATGSVQDSAELRSVPAEGAELASKGKGKGKDKAKDVKAKRRRSAAKKKKKSAYVQVINVDGAEVVVDNEGLSEKNGSGRRGEKRGERSKDASARRRSSSSTLASEQHDESALRSWQRCGQCQKKHWSDESCPRRRDAKNVGQMIATMRKKWTRDTTAALYEYLLACTQGSSNPGSNGGKASKDEAAPFHSTGDSSFASTSASTPTSTSSTSTASTPPLSIQAPSSALQPASSLKSAILSLAAASTSTPPPTTAGEMSSAKTDETTQRNGQGVRAHVQSTDEGLQSPQPSRTPLQRSAPSRTPRELQTAGSSHSEELQEYLIKETYRIVNAKHEITCGADGRYGITGNVTRGSMRKMLSYLRSECELDETASIIDLGHGMGRPNLHIASLVPFVKASVGTEFNPGLYKLSMIILRELARKIPSFYERPRVFFMDMNIRDIVNLAPFTHIYIFNIGMPDDLILHVFRLILTCRTAKYAIIYPHRLASARLIATIGTVVKTISMSMPGGCSYEGMIVKLHPYEHRLRTMTFPEKSTGEEEEVPPNRVNNEHGSTKPFMSASSLSQVQLSSDSLASRPAKDEDEESPSFHSHGSTEGTTEATQETPLPPQMRDNLKESACGRKTSAAVSSSSPRSNDDVATDSLHGNGQVEPMPESRAAENGNSDGDGNGDGLEDAINSFMQSVKAPTIVGHTNYDTPTAVRTEVDPDIAAVFKILGNAEIYKLYVEQLGLAGALDKEQEQMRSSRSSRKSASKAEYFRLSPCLPDIPIGLLRRVCVGLGISTIGDKVSLLSTIQDYVPLSFRLSLFATGREYTVADVNTIISELLAREPSRRQPELT